MRSLLRYSIAPLFLIASACGGEPPPPAGETVDFDLRSQSNEVGYPDGFDYDMFINTIQPILIAKCAAAGGCHDSAALHPLTAGVDPAKEYGIYTVWKDAKADAPEGSAAANNLVKNFNHFIWQLDYDNPSNSLILTKGSGSTQHTGGAPLLPDSAEYATILAFLEAGQAKRGTTEPPVDNNFDFDTFQANVQPILDSSGCSGALGACHGASGSAGNAKYALVPNATSAADLQANFAATIAEATLVKPVDSVVYYQATHAHLGSVAMADSDAQTLLDWIQDAAEAKCNNREGCEEGPIDPPAGCVPPEQFNALVFANEILPILAGDVDLNDPNNENGIPTGCTRGPCHGSSDLNKPGSLYLGGSDQESLASFGCFVNLNNPTFSQVLLCPLKSPNCLKRPHPGDKVFVDTNDLNYQRIASFIAASSKAPPFDFAFFAEKINPLFFTPNGDNQTCADTGQCHGVSSPGVIPPNGSDFPILGGSDITALTYNFLQAASFADFFNAANSPLLLYPTDTIGDFVPGLIHPPGAVIDVGSPEALDIEKWAAGLRLDAQGFNANWLVAGEYLGVQDINDSPLQTVEDGTLNPRIFDASGGQGECQDNPCEWQAFFSDVADVNLNDPDFGFPRDVAADRTAYAIAYIVNVSGLDITNGTILVTTDPANDLEVFVNGQLAGTAAGGVANAAANFPALRFGEDAIATPVVIKIFQPEGEVGDNFTFTAQFLDDNDDPLLVTDVVILLNSYAEGI